MDTSVKDVSDNKKQLLAILARQAIHMMDLELTYKLLDEKMQQVATQNKALMDIAFIQSHEFRGPLTSLMGIMNLIIEEGHGTSEEYMDMMDDAVHKLDEKIHAVVRSTEIAKQAYIS